MLETVQVESLSLPALYNFYRLVDTLVTCKKDTYLDVLQVIAYHTSKIRRIATRLLMTFWPSAVGHVVISKGLSLFSHPGMLSMVDNVPSPPHTPYPYAHNFVPWRFKSSVDLDVFLEASIQCCQSCTNVIRGFGLLCTGCFCAVHFDCYSYPEGNALLEWATSDKDTRKMAVHRYCLVSAPRKEAGVYEIRSADHIFALVHIFTLPLCFICRNPIWGCQAMHCTSCKLFTHFTCITENVSELQHCGSIELDYGHITVSLSKIRQSFTDFYGDIFLSFEDLGKRSYEEISVSSAVLWTQLQIYNNGEALGCFALERSAIDDENFELPYLVQLYEAYLSSGKLPVSPNLMEYLQTNSQEPSSHSIMFDWPTLAYITSIIKMPWDASSRVGDSPGFLSVGYQERDDDLPRRPYEVVPLSHIYDALGYEFHIQSRGPAWHCLMHLHKLGFFCCLDSEPFSPSFSTSNKQECYFPLPLGLDLTTDVEVLVSTIESCLSDLDLSVNEAGFLLLVRRFWPDSLMSEYALHRLTSALIVWICGEVCSLPTF